MDRDMNVPFYNLIYRTHLKRVFDLIISVSALIMLSPIMCITALLIKFKLGSPVLFKQNRPGKDEKLFTLYKFRTMTDSRDEKGELLRDSERLPRFGKLLRSTSLDELPELFNIILGDMSIVGPRPLMINYLPYYTDDERRRHTVRPGLTGLAQINGRGNSLWEERFHYDISYIETLSFKLDCRIILETVFKVLKRTDIGEPDDEHVIAFDQYRIKASKQQSRLE